MNHDSTPSSRRALAPAVDIAEDADGITLRADMPGVPRDALQVQIDGDTLKIRGDIEPALGEGGNARYVELRHGAWERSFTLSRELDSAHVDAALKDGVLTLRIPKAEHARPRRVEVALG
ncbi:spore protein SP21 [mine drainage metagenome]|jgi:HSP20 family molecular chaperone IbpA|uniref:Spore protein SP21 n=1 Tax=mine drainage metagenome TaxID=410659 RepID=A0A1J5Q8I3_9ZZZZ